MYIVCQNPSCAQTYDAKLFNKDSRDVACEKCGGTVIGKNGEVTVSNNKTVLSYIPNEDLTDEDPADREPEHPEKIFHIYTCESGCGHTTIIDKFYKTKRVFCGVCGTKSNMKYQGECTVNKTRTKSAFNL